jgi:hypothetical protein
MSNLDRTIGLAGREENVYLGPERQGDAWLLWDPSWILAQTWRNA